ncbi:MAG: choice-of-anchor J domain-containing protein [Muribaculaceae bacterium]|nr:choice-of-anchor J domain-containing protein [Muribaculaceae bacterium]
MKQFLLLSLMAASLIGASAQTDAVSIKKMGGKEKATMLSKGSFAVKDLPADILKSENKGVRTASKDAQLTPPSTKSTIRSTSRDGFVLYENFSDWDGTMEWVPEGWSKEHYGTGSASSSWFAGIYEYGIPCRPVDGLYLYGIGYSDTDKQDEWLITPEVEISEGMQLTYWLYLRPLSLYDYNALGKRYALYTLQIMVQPEGGEWVTVRDYAEDYKDYEDIDLYKIVYQMTQSTDMYKQTVSLADFVGKKVKIAFRYVGKDGDAVFIDGVGVGLPEIENVTYTEPANVLFYGLSHNAFYSGLTNDVAIYPVNAPLKWVNSSDADATYSWEYQITESLDFQTSANQKELEVTYHPDYSSPISISNNFYYPPTLTAKAPGKASGFYKAPYFCLQAGGKPRFEFDDTYFECCMLPFPLALSDWDVIGIRDGKLGAWSVAVFGHNEFTDDYWLNYYLNGAEKKPGNYASLRGIANVFWPSKDASLVLNGINIYGYGRIWPEAQLKVSVYALPSTGNGNVSANFEDFKKIGETTVTGEVIETAYGEDSKDLMYIPFRFDAPVIVRGSDEYLAYAFMFEGFNSEHVEEFMPAQSINADPFGRTFGYTLHEIDLSGQEGGLPKHYEFEKIRYSYEGKEMHPDGGFAIGLVGEYPWLTAESDKIVLGKDDIEGVASLGSYYDGSRLSVELPEGLFGYFEGQYNDCKLKVRRLADTTATITGNAVVKGPGVEVTIPVEAAPGQSNVDEIITDSVVEAYYDLSGRKVISPEAGIYIVKYSDGKVRKVVVK